MTKKKQHNNFIVFKDSHEVLTPCYWADDLEGALKIQWAVEMEEPDDNNYRWLVAEILPDTGVEGWLIKSMRKIINYLHGG